MMLRPVIRRTTAWKPWKQSHRCLNLHEYQSKQLMAENGIDVQKFCVVDSIDSAHKVLRTVQYPEYVVKAQILAGGRGKGTFKDGFKGGVHLTKDQEEAAKLSCKMLHNVLVTKQTGDGGVSVEKVMVAEALDIVEEKYLAIVLDREANGPVIVASPEGGMDIEEVAASKPEKIFKLPVSYLSGVSKENAIDLAKKLQFKGDSIEMAAVQIQKLFELFTKLDCTQLEINPLGLTPSGRVVCFDAKLNFDDSAKFRQKRIFEMEDAGEMDKSEVEATQHGLNFIKMDGNIGCLVNGAGLAMATMDIIKLHGGEPANFLDVGGGVTQAQVTTAFQIITSDQSVKSILVNIFGGIVNCATIANGIIEACKKTSLAIPLVVRLEGTNVTEAKKILDRSGLPIITADDIGDAADKVVQSLNP